jgi:hypothetical protein
VNFNESVIECIEEYLLETRKRGIIDDAKSLRK